jgi:hypothetical protein
MLLGYLNPDTGSMILQALLGGAAGLAVLLRLFGHRVLVALKLRKAPQLAAPEPAPSCANAGGDRSAR